MLHTAFPSKGPSLEHYVFRRAGSSFVSHSTKLPGGLERDGSLKPSGLSSYWAYSCLLSQHLPSCQEGARKSCWASRICLSKQRVNKTAETHCSSGWIQAAGGPSLPTKGHSKDERALLFQNWGRQGPSQVLLESEVFSFPPRPSPCSFPVFSITSHLCPIPPLPWKGTQ